MTVERVPAPEPRGSRTPTLPPIPTDYDRLQPLYDIQTVLAQPIGVEQACEAILPIVTRILRIRTVVLLDTMPDINREFLWAAAGTASTVVQEARDHARTTLAYLARQDVRSPNVVSRAAILVGGVVEPTVPRHLVTLPLVVHEHVFGVFQLEGAAVFGERDLLFMNVVVNQLAVALDRHHVQLALEASRFEAERANRRLRDLQAVSDAALEGATLDESLAAVLRTMRSMFRTDAAAVLLADADGKTLRCRSSVGLDNASDLEVAIGVGAEGRIAAGTTAMRFDVRDDVADVSPALVANGVRSLIGAAMRARDRVIGVVYVASRRTRAFDEDELQLVELVADRIGTIIDNAALYEQALAAIRGRDAVMGVVSHDLRNPLNAIQMCTELFPDSPHLAKPVAIIKRSVDLMVRLISDLRDVGSIEAGHLSIRTRPESSAALVRDAIDGIKDAAAEKSLHVAMKLPTRDLVVDCDRTRIIQVLTNLLSNAIKFTPQRGSVTLSMTDVVAGQVRFSIEDTGAGIAAVDLPHVFDRYWQAKATAHLGTGLGLAITKGIVDAHGGTISVESRVGTGTTFSFTLPLAPEQRAPAGALAPEAAAQTARARVLVVDDEPNALSALASLLEDEGFVVATAPDGLAALPKVREFDPDILVVDVEMPGLKGDDLVRKVRHDHTDLPVILMTGHGEQVVAAARMELDASYIAKPVDIDELVSAIHRELGGKRDA